MIRPSVATSIISTPCLPAATRSSSSESGAYLASVILDNRLRLQTLKRSTKTLAVAVAMLLGLAASAALAAPGWRVAAAKSVTGQFAITATSATIKHPAAIAVNLTGRVSTGVAVVACSKGFSVSSYSRSYTHAGLYVLKINPARADSCQITASAGGSGRIVVQILKK